MPFSKSGGIGQEVDLNNLQLIKFAHLFACVLGMYVYTYTHTSILYNFKETVQCLRPATYVHTVGHKIGHLVWVWTCCLLPCLVAVGIGIRNSSSGGCGGSQCREGRIVISSSRNSSISASFRSLMLARVWHPVITGVVFDPPIVSGGDHFRMWPFSHCQGLGSEMHLH